MTTTSEERRLQTASRLAALTLANAFIAQAELAEVDPNVRPLREVLADRDPVRALAEHWQFICDTINYVPIFHLAIQVLLRTSPRAEVYQALRALGNEVLGIVSERAALRHDLMGRIYHRLLLEAKYLGTFYTSVPAATLLLKLALAADHWEVDWADVGAINHLRIADLACGTGTLLMAAQQAITDNYIRAMAENGLSIDTKRLSSLHQVMMQEVLYGFDVLPSALHLTASTLAMLAPEIAFRKMHLYSMPLGEQPGGQVALGSIEFLTSAERTVQLDLMGEISAEGDALAITGQGEVAAVATVPPLDLCVMNPPFVRSVGGNLLFGSMPEKQRKKMQKKLQSMLSSDRPTARRILANSTAGLGSVFAAVGDMHLKPHGRMALVLPIGLGFGVAWAKTRELLAQRYDVEYLVVSHDPRRWSFSENTSLSEILVVARKRDDASKVSDANTVCVNLWRNTDKPIDGLGLADAILHTEPALIEGIGVQSTGTASLAVNGTKRGEMVTIPWSSLRMGQWHPCSFAQTDLIRAAHFLRQGRAYFPSSAVNRDLPVSALSTLGELGPDRRDIYDGFTIGGSKTNYPALWGHAADAVTTLEVGPNMYLTPRSEPLAGRPERPVGLLWPKAGRIMIAERLRLNTQRLVAVRISELALSNVWWPLQLSWTDESAEKIAALWLNSTLGLITLVSFREPTEGSWVQFKKPMLGQVPVLDARKLTEAQRQVLVDTFDSVARLNLQPLPSMDEDPVRQAIDDAVTTALGLPSLKELRQLLSREPVVSGQPLS